MIEAAYRYAIGDRVRVLDDNPAGNPRTPRYARGRAGTVTDLHGVIVNPRDHRVTYPPLYTVVFPIVPGSARGDLVAADIHEEWLEPADEGGKAEVS